MTDKLQEIKEDYLLGDFFGKPWVSIPKINFDWLIETIEQLESENGSIAEKHAEKDIIISHQQSRIQELETMEKEYEALKKAL